jgi:hypothetical protein
VQVAEDKAASRDGKAKHSRLAELNKRKDATVDASKGLTAAERIRVQLDRRSRPQAKSAAAAAEQFLQALGQPGH